MRNNKKSISYLIAAIVAISMGVTAFASVPEEPSPQTNTSQSAYQSESFPDGNQAENTESLATEAPPKKSDAPLFVGAGISVIVFGGVVVFCKMKGNR
jgi:hypothetical protein